jgi:beta-galactosidase
MYSLPFDDIHQYRIGAGKPLAASPQLKKGSFKLSKVADTYLDMSGWGKGSVWVNGHNLGRYWYIGPQQTLYIPAEWLKKGDNEVIVLELIKPEQNILKGTSRPILDAVIK